MAEDVAIRQVSDLQSKGPALVAEEVTPLQPAPVTVSVKAGAGLTIDSKADTPRDRSADQRRPA